MLKSILGWKDFLHLVRYSPDQRKIIFKLESWERVISISDKSRSLSKRQQSSLSPLAFLEAFLLLIFPCVGFQGYSEVGDEGEYVRLKCQKLSVLNKVQDFLWVIVFFEAANIRLISSYGNVYSVHFCRKLSKALILLICFLFKSIGM